ncbi:conserved Plasmodium protein, unknown function [Plasmodium sp. gorilla clade G2]|uniref:conserved Plasmodium protein, unknown function n=1 Tax=Plasmodium sp. gorilla clade G2 TaxID=880535 RepID=UPI000D217696|nr:conserved Plasmodium protein, unknown function [Plasmodium sp. gorilla clade G2]SOV17609.1 conserved Plasmodium protein, unknown function [Plasmodium sp. gorilla clade G2]
MNMDLVLFISLICLLFGCSNKLYALRNVKVKSEPVSEKSSIVNSLISYKEEIDSQIKNFKKYYELPNEMDFELKELWDLVNIVSESQESQMKELFNFSHFLEQSKLSLFKMLSEYENRIDQLEYNIMEKKIYDPFIEKFIYPISKYWLKIDFNNLRSYWKYENNKNDFSIIQANNLSNINIPATILLLRHHKLINGYINVDIKPLFDDIKDFKQSSSGIIFDFVDYSNYRYIELAFINSDGIISVYQVVNGLGTKIVSKQVEADPNTFTTITAEFLFNKINVFLNYKMIIEIKITNQMIDINVGLFSKIGKAEFKNILSGNIDIEKLLSRKLVESNEENISKVNMVNSYRFLNKMNIDNLGVYEIPYNYNMKDYDNFEDNIIDNVYAVPDSDSYYDDENITGWVKNKNINNNEFENNYMSNKNINNIPSSCTNYNSSNNIFYLTEFIINNSSALNWKITNEFGIQRIHFKNDYKKNIFNASLVYKHSTCNSVTISSYIKLEYNSEAGLIFRYENINNMYILIISTNNKEILLKKIINDIPTIVKSKYIQNINTYQRHHLLINDHGENGHISIFLNNIKIFSISNENYYKSSFYGLYVQSGYAAFDTFQIEAHKKN